MSAAPTPRLLPIDELNRASPAAFVEALRPLFEAAGPLGDRLAAGRPYASYAALLDAASDAADALTPSEQVTVVNAHPRIGESAAAVRQTSALSYREQGYDAESADSAAEAERARVQAELDRLNAAYEARFGFRYCVFVAGRPRAALLPGMEAALEADAAAERARALDAVVDIAADRYRKLAAT
jgi:2-oxo-4-hydroxy-4-carboxy-5-ureidoimidazoline decarboxylase